MPEEPVPQVEAAGVIAEEPFHAHDEVGLGCLGDEMKMISHEAPGPELPAGFVAGFAQSGQETAAILIIAEDGFAAVAAIHQVIDGSGKLDPQRPWHASTSTPRSLIVNC